MNRARRASLLVMVFSLLSVFFVGSPAMAVSALPGNYHGSDRLNPGEELWAWSAEGRGSEFLLSQNQGLQFFAQNDFNLVIYAGRQANWSIRRDRFPQYPSGYTVTGVFLRMEPSGDLVYYARMRSWNGSCCTYLTLWHSNTGGNWGSTLYMQNDGNLVVYNGQGRATWSLLIDNGVYWWRNPNAH